MLNPHDLTEILCQANTGGVLSTLLVNSHGSLVAFSGLGDTAVKVKAAVSNSIWSAYENGKHNAMHDDALNCLTMSCNNGIVAVRRVGTSGLLLCMFCQSSTTHGILKAKIDAMAEYLKGPLGTIAVS